MDKGISCVAATLGERGAVAGIDGQLFRVHVPVLKAVNVVGCGDAFVGAMCAGYYRRTPVEEIIRMAAATGAANALTEEAGGVNLNDMRALLGEIRIEPIS
ncbi:Tagatose-6-phosphate kinase [compost metagenome]